MQSSGKEARQARAHDKGEMLKPYGRFLAMILSSTVVMFALTYTNVFELAHIRFSQERAYMALVMGSAMTIVMMAFMWKMYPDARANAAIMAGALLIGTASFLASQTQAFVADVAYMDAMIPHHSIAILTSERASIVDIRVQLLAQDISDTQVREIQEMSWLADDIRDNGPALTQAEADGRPVPEFSPQR